MRSDQTTQTAPPPLARHTLGRGDCRGVLVFAPRQSAVAAVPATSQLTLGFGLDIGVWPPTIEIVYLLNPCRGSSFPVSPFYWSPGALKCIGSGLDFVPQRSDRLR
jgi:hypothetical protein